MRKITALLLLLCISFALFSLTSCDVLVIILNQESIHTHNQNGIWQSDDTHHWQSCGNKNCTEELNKSVHTWNEGEIIKTATAESNGIKEFACTRCGYTKTTSYQAVDQTTPETITVALILEFPPYEYISNGEYAGVHIDLAKEIAIRTNSNLEFEVVEFHNIIDGISEGIYDIAFGFEKTPERMEFVSFTDPYYCDENGEMYAIFQSDSFKNWTMYKKTLQEMIADGTVNEILLKHGLNHVN